MANGAARGVRNAPWRIAVAVLNHEWRMGGVGKNAKRCGAVGVATAEIVHQLFQYAGIVITPMVSHPTFAECFCARHGVPREGYARAVFARALYRRARPVAWLLPVFRRDYFEADFDLIHEIEWLRRAGDFEREVERFYEHPRNRGCLRQGLRLRISTHRLKRLVRETLRAGEGEAGSGIARTPDRADGAQGGES